MTISMYKTSVPIFVQFLTSMSTVLDKAAAHCEAKKIEPATLHVGHLGHRRGRAWRHDRVELGARPTALDAHRAVGSAAIRTWGQGR